MEKLQELKRAVLKEHAANSQSSVLISILAQMMEFHVTAEMLSQTEAGLAVNKLRKHADPAVVEKARAVIKKWKQDVTGGTTKITTSTLKIKTEVVTSTSTSAVSLKRSHTEEILSPMMSSPITPAFSPVDSQAHTTDDDMSMDGIRIVPGTSRSTKIDKILIKSLGDAVRDKSVDIIYTALATNTDADTVIIEKKAVGIEDNVFKHFANKSSQTPAYREKIRSLFLNLKDAHNPTLKLRVLCGSLSVKNFCTMTPEDMKSAERLAEEKVLRDQNIFNAKGAGPQQAETDQFKCGKCHKRKCRYYQMQTRSADEPMTTFVTCVNCNNRWKFC